MTSIRRNATLLALVQAFAACAGGVVREPGRTMAKVASATTHSPALQTGTSSIRNEEEKEKIAVAERILFRVYRRGGKYHVAAELGRPGIDWITVPDITTVEPAVESVAAAFRYLAPVIRKAYAEGPRHAVGEDVDDRRWEQMGAKNSKQFVRSTSLCLVARYPDQIEIFYMVPDPKGYVFWGVSEEPDAKLPPDASYEDIARAVLEIFAKNPPPPGDKPAAPKRPRKSTATE